MQFKLVVLKDGEKAAELLIPELKPLSPFSEWLLVVI